jgi:rSAM/selenodomain-associated transferase 2
VIIPTLDEYDEIEATLGHAVEALGLDAEVIVVDGGSTDGTPGLIRETARVITRPPCRGDQLRTGAEEATGGVLVFLHADTWLPPGTGAAILAQIRAGATSGCLHIGFREPGGLRYRILAAAINLRTRVFRTATGDQAIFATREAYDRSGGVPPIQIFEDVRFVRRLRATGAFRALPLVALTSTRRWEQNGFYRTVFRHIWLRSLHALGADPERLALRYL